MGIKKLTARHPQEAIHASSLIQDDVNGVDDSEAQQFWLNASRGLKWFKRPSIVRREYLHPLSLTHNQLEH